MRNNYSFTNLSLKHLLSALLAFAALGAVTASSASAQDAPTARSVLAQVETFYNQTDTFQAQFHQTYYNRLYQRYERSRGVMSFDKPGRMRFDYRGNNGKVIVADGTSMTMWEPSDGHGPGQLTRSRMEQAALPGAFSFLTGEGSLSQDYRPRLLNSRAWRYSGHVLELRPRRADPRYRRIILFVDSDPARAGIVHRLRIDDHNGNRNKFEIRAMRFNRAMPQGHFAFSPPRGARVVTL